MRFAFPLTLVVLAAGCLGAPAPVIETVEDAPTPEEGYRPNLLLLGSLAPPSATVHGGAEPMVLPSRDGSTLWIASTGGAARSRDGGATWHALDDPFLLTADGWSLAEDESGRLYASTTAAPYVEVYHSDDQGDTWHASVSPFTGIPLTGAVDAAPVADRPWMAARGDGEVTLIFYDLKSTMEGCLRTTTGAAAWVDRNPAWGYANAGRPDYNATGVFGYVSTSGFLHRMRTGPADLACTTMPVRTLLFNDKGTQTQVATSAGPEGAFYSAAPSGGNAAIVLASYHQGATPAVKRLVVSPPELRHNAMATVSAAPNGEVVVAWYGTQTAGDWNEPGFDGAWNVYVARVTGFWTESPTIEHVRITAEPNHVGDICTNGVGCSTGDGDRDLLDYFGVEHDAAGRVHVAYAHDGTGTSTVVRHAVLPALG